jgi:hypothetical protein
MVLKQSFDEFLDQWIDIESEYWETSAYIKSTMKKYLRSTDMLGKSMVLMWFDAKTEQNFGKFQDIGDWVFFTSVYLPGSIPCDPEFYQSVGRSSYYRCYRMLDGAWPVYEELADRFHDFVEQLAGREGIEC